MWKVGKQEQTVLYKRSEKSLSAAVREVEATDFPIRMRNKLAADLRHGETVIDDDYVGIAREQEKSRWGARRSLPQFGVALVTTQRLWIVTVDGEHIADHRLDRIQLIHDEDNVLTMTVRKQGGQTEPVSLIFQRRRAPVAQFLRAPSDRRPTEGPATPGASTRERFKAKLDRLRPNS